MKGFDLDVFKKACYAFPARGADWGWYKPSLTPLGKDSLRMTPTERKTEKRDGESGFLHSC